MPTFDYIKSKARHAEFISASQPKVEIASGIPEQVRDDEKQVLTR